MNTNEINISQINTSEMNTREINTSDMKFSICHMYPDLLNLYGDRGNILALKKRCEWRGIGVEIHNVGIGQEFTPQNYDLIFLGGGQDFEQSLILDDLVNVKGDAIRDCVNNGKVFLCICGGYQMMGEYYLDQSGNKMKCLNAIPIHTIAGTKRLIGNVVCQKIEHDDSADSDESDDSADSADSDESGESGESDESSVLVGFENHSGRTYLGEGVKPLAKVIKGYGNNSEDGFEGARFKNVYCTYMHGSFLPKNPKIADVLIKTALEQKYGHVIDLECLPDVFEKNARRHIITCKN